MYKNIFLIMFLLFPGLAFSQNLSTLALCGFEVSGRGLTQEHADELRRQCIAEMSSWGVLTLVEEDRADEADYVVRGRLSAGRNSVILSASTFEGNTEKSLAQAKEEAANVKALSEQVFSFCIQIVQPVPFPNYLIGEWESTIPLSDGALICRMEFKSNRTVVVKQYDTYEYRPGSVLRYYGYGTGSYTYIGRVKRPMTFRDSRGTVYRESLVDGSVTISVSLEDALPAYESLNSTRIYMLFDEAKTSFELVSGAFPCGENNGGPSVYPQKNMAYTHFRKIN